MGQLEHGAKVWIVLKDSENEGMVFVESPGCKGRVSEAWLSDKPREPKGENVISE